MRLPSLTVFFPCYNDAGTIPTMLLRALQTLPLLTDDYEVVVINDGSQDDSALVLDEMARLYPQHVRVTHRAQPSGYGGVLRGARTKRFKGHVARACTGTMAQACSFYALTVLPLAVQSRSTRVAAGAPSSCRCTRRS